MKLYKASGKKLNNLDRSNVSRLCPASGRILSHTNQTKPIKIVLYSHDTMGLGHIRRNFLIAKTLSKSNLKCSILIISGTNKANEYALPDNVDIVSLPSLYKDKKGNYKSRQLDISTEQIIKLRSDIIKSAVKAFSPDLLIVDKVPRGVLNELDSALRHIRRNNSHTKCILGLRDILDEPEVVKKEWKDGKYNNVISKYYDDIWVYGDKSLYDIAAEYSLPEVVQSKITYSGYLVKESTLKSYLERRNKDLKIELKKGRMVLCLLGGGQDGYEISKAFVKTKFPENTCGVLLTGPFMDAEHRNEIMAIATNNKNVLVYGFVPNPNYLLLKADRVIAMGGYNTICELISHNKKALIVPRVVPRLEQIIRAQKLNELNLFDYIHPDDIDAGSIGGWITKDYTHNTRASHIDLDGVDKLPIMVRKVLNQTQNILSEEKVYAAK